MTESAAAKSGQAIERAAKQQNNIRSAANGLDVQVFAAVKKA